jgi:ABC-type polysaccharide/polyol phosphate transport system ATPase subunit
VTGDPIISLDGVWKRYVKYEDAPMLISRVMGLRARSKRGRLWALRGLDLSVARGECLGVIGRNGSGKSTLLRLLAGVTAPSKGAVAVSGRISPLIAVGVGFHPELTGRENVYVNGIVLGLSRAEIDRRFDEIVAFAEVEDFIDTPVKFYSSGMFVRLGFSVAVAVDPGVLLVDEVLAVGDFAFQIKCFDRMMQVRDSGTTIVVVSHNLNAIRRMCDRSIVLDAGRICHDGDTAEAVSLFHELLGAADEPEAAPVVLGGTGFDVRARITQLRLLDGDGRSTGSLASGSEARAEIDVEFEREVVDPVVSLHVTNEAGVHAYASHGRAGEGPSRLFGAGDRATFTASIRMHLTTGSYTLQMNLAEAETLLTVAVPVRGAAFYVANPSGAHGIADLEARFGEVDGAR